VLVNNCRKVHNSIARERTGASAMLDKPISPLRERMIDDMTAALSQR
jgi:hypothetical protein